MNKPWTISRGPIVAAEIDVHKAEAINALLVRPIQILPAKVGDPILPFAIGLFEEIRTLLKPDVPATALRRAAGAFVHSKRYYLASAQPDSFRHGIDGAVLEPLSVEDRMTAQSRFLALKQNRQKSEAPPEDSVPAAPAISKSEQIRASLLGGRLLRPNRSTDSAERSS
ncbi:ProQ/FINO family protein [Rhizobium mayense]|uniref:ProQ/FINO family protein n=1 Tax=Rhizobium mayense TaxID=1312184 RepID=A0ABT7K9K8_9HYPH|nr:ProQ/FINO family protein [Rhizobium mayense]MDL2403819.1 ProQ/FINO family protein [Rhizobium mayense]